MKAPKRPALLLALPLVLFCASCGPKPVRIATPPVERFAPVAEPEIPAEDTDAEIAGYLIALITALREANDRIEWLRDWRDEVAD